MGLCHRYTYRGQSSDSAADRAGEAGEAGFLTEQRPASSWPSLHSPLANEKRKRRNLIKGYLQPNNTPLPAIGWLAATRWSPDAQAMVWRLKSALFGQNPVNIHR